MQTRSTIVPLAASIILALCSSSRPPSVSAAIYPEFRKRLAPKRLFEVDQFTAKPCVVIAEARECPEYTAVHSAWSGPSQGAKRDFHELSFEDATDESLESHVEVCA